MPISMSVHVFGLQEETEIPKAEGDHELHRLRAEAGIVPLTLLVTGKLANPSFGK